ncbi:MAG: hypothetical protein EOM92_21990 [Gammaproteobacteria bacterium]|nr:hypothetical protein [Gammaproteobacteria bacterium]
MPNPYMARPRAEVASAPLTAVEDNCKADAEYLASVAEIVGRVLKEAIKATDTPSEPDTPQPSARTRRAWSAIVERKNASH